MNAHVDVLIWDAQDCLAEKRGFVRTCFVALWWVPVGGYSEYAVAICSKLFPERGLWCTKCPMCPRYQWRKRIHEKSVILCCPKVARYFVPAFFLTAGTKPAKNTHTKFTGSQIYLITSRSYRFGLIFCAQNLLFSICLWKVFLCLVSNLLHIPPLREMDRTPDLSMDDSHASVESPKSSASYVASLAGR